MEMNTRLQVACKPVMFLDQIKTLSGLGTMLRVRSWGTNMLMDCDIFCTC